MAPAGRPGYAGRDNSVARAATRRPAGGGAVLAGAVGLAPLPLIRPPRRYGARCVDWRARPACLGTIPARAGEPWCGRCTTRPTRDYPRAGGGTSGCSLALSEKWGLSPRGRGHPRMINPGTSAPGTIPARAGEPLGHSICITLVGDYPRAGGGTIEPAHSPSPGWGLSPRGRGNRTDPRRAAPAGRTIPARAGEPVGEAGFGRGARGLSPRGRGNPLNPLLEILESGTIPARAGEPRNRDGPGHQYRDYPRAGGGTSPGYCRITPRPALSPRGRGNPHGAGRSAPGRRTIPARAGEPDQDGAPLPRLRDYPRAGGGTRHVAALLGVAEGLSPRGRGNHRHRLPVSRAGGTIPARAGEPHPRGSAGRRGRDYPRAGGGTRDDDLRLDPAKGLSPRGRGNLWRGQFYRRKSGTIPARAGEPSSPRSSGCSSGDYPRAGGGTQRVLDPLLAGLGLSPRGRGNHGRAVDGEDRAGTIPARAGEPPTSRASSARPRDYPRAGGGTIVLPL